MYYFFTSQVIFLKKHFANSACKIMFFFNLSEFRCFTILCSFLLYSKVNLLYVCIYPFFWLPSYIGHHRALLSHKMEKAMAPHSCALAWKIPRMEEPGELQSMGLLRVRHDWTTSLSLFTFMHWRRKWQPTPVFLPGESQGQGSLLGCRLWGRTELDMSEVI